MTNEKEALEENIKFLNKKHKRLMKEMNGFFTDEDTIAEIRMEHDIVLERLDKYKKMLRDILLYEKEQKLENELPYKLKGDRK